jgi:DNA-binding winged helix-turn-helix (wHTH) protein/Tol biopolymer transport system component
MGSKNPETSPDGRPGPASTAAALEFDEFRLDPAERTLRRNGEVVPLTSKVFDTLLLLVGRAGRLATKDYLMKELWPDSFVEEVNLTQNISVLRKALGETAQHPKYVVTVPGHGYRFTGVPRELVPAGPSAGEPPLAPVTPSIASRWRPRSRRMAAALVACGLTGVAVAVASLVTITSRRHIRGPFDLTKARISRVTEGGNAASAAISPDGRTVAYAESDGDRYSIWVKQGAAGGKVQIVPPEATALMHLTFDPSGKDLYFTRRDSDGNGFVLYRIPATGGAETLVLGDVDTAVSFAPDGRQFVFMRQAGNGEYRIVIADTAGGRQRTLAVRKTPRMFSFVAPDWSPDGRLVAATAADHSGDGRWTVELLSVADGSSRAIYRTENQIGRVRWLPDGSGLLTVISETLGRQSPPWQAGYLAHISGGALWHISYPGAQAERLTDDLTDYDICCTDVAGDGRTIVGMQNTLVSDLWIANAAQLDRPTQITRDSPVYRRHGWLPDNDTIVYRGLNGSLHAAHRSGRVASLPLAEGHKVASGVSVCSDGRHAVFQSTPGYSLWRVALDRIEAVRLTSGHIDANPACSADGRSVVYSSVRPDFPSIWRVSIDGGEPAPLIAQRALEALPSPTGRLLYYFAVESNARSGALSEFRWVVVSPADSRRVFSRDAPVNARLGVSPVWAPDETGLDYVQTRNSVSNIWRQPLTGEPPTQITHFTSGTIFSFAWSPDGQWLSLASGASRSDVVLITGAR